MNTLRIVLSLLGIVLLLTGIVFLIAASEGNTTARVIIGLVMLAIGFYLLRTGLKKAAGKTVVIDRNIELSGDVSLEDLSCRNCGAGLSSENVSVRAGAVFASCPHCRSEYQLEEEPKW